MTELVIEHTAERCLAIGLFDPGALRASKGWAPFRKGVEILPLYGPTEDKNEGPSAALLRYGPGASVPEHEHRGYEHVIVLEGSQRDARGTYERGSCVISEPGSRHAVTSDHGCVVLVIWNQPVAFVAPSAPEQEPEGAAR